VEAVRVFSADGQTSAVYPELPYRTEIVSLDAINTGIGISESAEKIASMLTKMCLKSAAVDDGTKIYVEVYEIVLLKINIVASCTVDR